MRYMYGILIPVVLAFVVAYCIKKSKKMSFAFPIRYCTLILLLLMLEGEVLIPHVQHIAIYVYLIVGTLLLCLVQSVKIILLECCRSSDSSE